MGTHDTDISDALKRLSKQDFLNFGMQQVAYVRAVELEDKTVFMIHAADGTPLSVLESAETAELMLRSHDLEPITLH